MIAKLIRHKTYADIPNIAKTVETIHPTYDELIDKVNELIDYHNRIEELSSELMKHRSNSND